MALYVVERRNWRVDGRFEVVESRACKREDNVRLWAHRFVYNAHEGNGTRDRQGAWNDIALVNGITRRNPEITTHILATGDYVVVRRIN